MMERQDSNFHMELFEQVVAELGKKGIMSVLCTPTACPPAWLVQKHPEILYVDNRQVTRPFGARHRYCYNNEVYRYYSRRIAQEIGKQFGNNPYVLGFQIGNEFAQESSGRCHCKVCTEKFRIWAKETYGTIEALNRAWGTYAWGASYTDFSQITLPIASTEAGSMPQIDNYYDNPSLRLAYEHFCSDSIIEYFNIQLEEMKKYTSKRITTNSTDYYKMYEKADLYALDAYPQLREATLERQSFEYTFGKGIRKENFWVLEFSVAGGHGLWSKEGRLQPYPGAIRQSVLHSFISGAELLMHFQYKTFRFGAEQLNYALLDADRIPRRRYFEFQKTAKTFADYEEILQRTVVKKNEVAILFDYACLWALKIKPIHHVFEYIEFCFELYHS